MFLWDPQSQPCLAKTEPHREWKCAEPEITRGLPSCQSRVGACPLALSSLVPWRRAQNSRGLQLRRSSTHRTQGGWLSLLENLEQQPQTPFTLLSRNSVMSFTEPGDGQWASLCPLGAPRNRTPSLPLRIKGQTVLRLIPLPFTITEIF